MTPSLRLALATALAAALAAPLFSPLAHAVKKPQPKPSPKAAPAPEPSPIDFARMLPGDSTRRDVAAGIVPFGDGALVTGWTSIADGPAQGLLMRIDGEANLLWRLELGGDGTDLLFGAEPDSAGGFVCAGFTTSRGAGGADGWIVRVDTAGAVAWERTVGGPEDDRLTSIQPTRGGWMAAGQTSRGGNTDAWVLRLDRDGNEIGAWTWGDSAAERGLGLLALADGGCVVVGRIGEGREDVEAFITRLDSTGRAVWSRIVDGPGFQVAYHVRPHPDGSLVVTGYGYVGEAHDHDGLVLRLGADGRVIARYDLGGDEYDRATQSVVLNDGSIVTVGYSRRRAAADTDPVWRTTLYALDPGGRLLWTAQPPGEGVESGRWVAASTTGVWAAGQVSPPPGGSRVMVLRVRTATSARRPAETGR